MVHPLNYKIIMNMNNDGYYDEYNKLFDAKKNTFNHNYKPRNLRLKDYDYKGQFTEVEPDEKKLEVDEKIFHQQKVIKKQKKEKNQKS